MNLEIFCCSGGMAEGFHRAGIDFDVAVDASPDACDSYERNLGHRPVQLDARDLLRMAQLGWRPESLELFVADPPCTPWSRAGKRLGVEDERDMLGVTCELILLLRPRCYLIGNVPGLEDSTQWPHLQRALDPLRRAGYCVADFATLDAANYGVPQHRVRPFWFGHLKGPCLRWPEPTHGPPTGQTALPGCELRPWVTCREALEHLPADELGRPVRLRKRDPRHPAVGPDGLAPTIRGGGDGHSAPQVMLNYRHPPADADGIAPTIGAKDRGQGTVLVIHGERSTETPIDGPSRTITRNTHGAILTSGRPYANPHPPSEPDAPARTLTTVPRAGHGGGAAVMPWPWDRPSTTVCTRDAIPPPGHHPEEGSILSQPGAVVLSERAAAILQGFPEGWHFAGRTKRSRWSQLGQAMPPPLAEAVARSIAAQMAATSRPRAAGRG